MPKGYISKEYVPMVTWASVVAVILLGLAFFPKSANWFGWIQAVSLIVGLIVAITVPAIQRRQEAQERRQQVREIEVGHARRLHYLQLELVDLLTRISTNLSHLRATERHRCQRVLEDFLHRVFESHKHDLSDERIALAYELRRIVNGLIEELESGRSDRAVMTELEKRLQKLGPRVQVNVAQAERH